ncbi:MAG: phosphate signaling complex protein PhoU [Planctomycetota bacterium]
MKHLQRDLDRVENEIRIMGSMVEEAINKAMESLIESHESLALEVIQGDRAIDMREVMIEEECLKILALHQPVASDLRFLVTVLKVNNDLERMGDLAVNIAERAKYLSREVDDVRIPPELLDMVERVREMVGECIDCLIQLDINLAEKVRRQDDEIDDLNRRIFRIMQDYMHTSPKAIAGSVDVLSVSRHLERIGDLATNIAEDVIFTVKGDFVRHQDRRRDRDPSVKESPAETTASDHELGVG